MPVTSLFAALFAVMLVVLSARVIQRRRAARVALGDGGVTALNRAIRAQGNFAEYVPFALILLALMEMGEWSGWLVAGLGAFLFIGRLIHAFGVLGEPENLRYRVMGMSITFVTILSAALLNLVVALMDLL